MDALMQRRHEVIPYEIRAKYGSTVEEHATQCDRCLMLGLDDSRLTIADQFEEVGKPVWRDLAEVPRG